MSPEDILEHANAARLWSGPGGFADLDSAYQCQLAVSRLRQARGESVRGYKIGFTNRTIWEEYGVYTPMWAHVYDTTVTFFEGQGGTLKIGHLAEPRFVADLRAIGATVHDVDPATGKQFGFTHFGGHMRGHMDGCAVGIPGSFLRGYWPLLTGCRSDR